MGDTEEEGREGREAVVSLLYLGNVSLTSEPNERKGKEGSLLGPGSHLTCPNTGRQAP
jgi:hypothetical protein